MNKLLRGLLLTSILGLLAVSVRADAAFKPAVIDINKVVDSHFETEKLNTTMEDVIKKIQEQLDQASKQIQDKSNQLQELAEKAQDSLLKPEARAQAEADAQKLAEEIQRMQAEAQNFRAKNLERLQQRGRAHRETLLVEINQVVSTMATARGITLVIDKSVSPLTGGAAVVFSDPTYDLTDDVIKEVNKNRPPAPAPAPAAAPVTPSAAETAPAPAK